MAQYNTDQQLTINVNGHDHVIAAPPDSMLLYALRDNLGLHGPKFGCGLSECGACTIIMNGKAVRSCITPLSVAEEQKITTLEGLGTKEHPGKLQQAFIDEQAAQCGYCIGGMIMTAQALLEQNPHPSATTSSRRWRAISAAAAPQRIRPPEASPTAARERQMNDMSATLGRRGLFKLSGGLVVAFSLYNPADVLAANGAADARPIPGGVPPDAGELSAWLAVHPDNTVTLFTGKVDVGTGAETALAQIVAEELYFPIDRLNVVMGTTSVTVNQGPSYGSCTIRYAGPQLRHAAAAGKAALFDLAAEHFRVEASALAVENGVISVQGAPSRSISYGRLVDGKKLSIEIGASGKSFAMVVAPQAQLKDPATYTIVGTSVKRKDIPAKMTAEYTYIQDLKVPGMLHGRVVRPYGLGATLLGVDETGLKDIPGFVQVVQRDNFLGVVAETEWGAIQAAQKLGSVLDPQSPTSAQAKWSDWNGLPEMDKIWDTVRAAPGTDSEVSGNGDVDAALKTAAKTFQATYQTPFQMHGSIGPSCAVVDVKDDRCIIYSGTQMPHEARQVTARHSAGPCRAHLVRRVGRLWPQRLRPRDRGCRAHVAGGRPSGARAVDALG